MLWQISDLEEYLAKWSDHQCSKPQLQKHTCNSVLEIHLFSSQHGDVTMKLHPFSNLPRQKVTIAIHGGSGQSRSSSECPHMLAWLLQGLGVGSGGQHWPDGPRTQG